MKNILFNNKKNESFLSITRKCLDNIKTCGCRVGMRAVNGKLIIIIQLEWPNRHKSPIMLLKLPIILSGNSFNFYLYIIPKIIPNLLLYIYTKMCYKNHNYLTYKTQNIPFIIIS